MNPLGADPGQLDALARAFDAMGTELSHRHSSLGLWINTDRFWRGRAADEFRGMWSSVYSSQLNSAIAFLHEQASVLRANADQQRVASGEATSTARESFVSRLFGHAESAVSSVERQTKHDIGAVTSRVTHDVEVGVAVEMAGATAVWNAGYHDFAAVGGSPMFRKAIQEVSVVGDVAGVVAILPIPGVQEAAATVALAASSIVMVGHLAEMANAGKFDAGEFAEDAVAVAGAGIAREKIVTDAAMDAAKASEDADALGVVVGPTTTKAADLSQTVTQLAGRSNNLRRLDVLQTGVSAGMATGENVRSMSKDLQSGNYAGAAQDSLGLVSAWGGVVAGDRGAIVAGGAGTLNDQTDVIYR